MPTMSLAHPHVFVETGVTVVFPPDGGVAVRLDWTYDEFFSLLISSDLGIGLDPGVSLTQEEQALLDEQVTAWPEDYAGDLEVMQGQTILDLDDKQDHAMIFDAGIFKETHLRPIAAVTDPDAPLVIRAYDPTYYIAYDLVGEVQIEGRDDCSAQVVPPDLNTAYSMVDELLYGRPASDVGPDEYFPEVGAAFAATITVTCAAPL